VNGEIDGSDFEGPDEWQLRQNGGRPSGALSSKRVLRHPPLMDPQQRPHIPSQKDDPEWPDKVQAVCAALADIGFSVGPEDLNKLHGADEYELELVVMAEVNAYFEIASKRVIDAVPLRIAQRYLHGISSSCLKTLVQKLELGSSTATIKCAQYLMGDPGVARAREEQTARKRRLESIRAELS